MDPKIIALRVVVYAALYILTIYAGGTVLTTLGGFLFGATLATFAGAWAANFFSLKMFEPRPFADLGLHWTRASGRNLLLGLAGGAGCAVLVLGIALAAGVAKLEADTAPSAGSIAWVSALLLIGSSGEELLFRGYGFQLLLRETGPNQTVLPVGVLFAALHSDNPGSTWLALVNTAGFGILFGYAFLRSRDLWMPIGLHFGWNLALPLAGVNVSGFTMKLTAYSLAWKTGPLWSGGDYGLEGSVLTSGALVALLAYILTAPVQRQDAPFTSEVDS